MLNTIQGYSITTSDVQFYGTLIKLNLFIVIKEIMNKKRAAHFPSHTALINNQCFYNNYINS